ncbi:MAG: aminopeptidase [Intestinibacter sp.]|uniref:aminopeptidase n=1 Tax=Intestinibacter sp. TaxID=1965304 RepID=UPI003F142235
MELKYELRNGWKVIDEMDNMKNAMQYSDEYMDFLNKGKTERRCVKEIERLAIEGGFKPLEEFSEVKPGDKIYCINRNKNIALFIIGKKDIEKGLRIIGSHIDSPRLDLKPNPLYEDDSMGYFKTHYYGGIKKYQWVTIPLALYGVVVLEDGSSVEINIGDEENDPVFCVTDLLPHLAAKQKQKTLADGIEGEDLNVLIGSIPDEKEEKDKVKANILKLLNSKYNLVEEDFISAEIEVVPAGKARNVGFDSSMILSYGHDDRVCSFAAVKAILDTENPEYTVSAFCADKEETGSEGNTGMHSRFYENTVAELINLQTIYSDLKLRRAFSNSKVLSADVNAGYDPNYPSVYEKNNSCHVGCGVCISKYTGARGKSGTSDANAEFVGEIRSIFNEANVAWQSGELGKVDEGGGGTIAYILANYNAQVLDCGVGVLSMHAPYEIISKADIFEMYRGYKAFFNK